MECLHPSANPLLFGFEDVESMLARQFRAERLHHSLLISGPKGVGKATLAYRLGRFILSGGADLQPHAAPPTYHSSLFGDDMPADDSAIATGGQGALYMPPEHGIFKRVSNGSHADMLAICPAFDAKKGAYKDIIQADAARALPEFFSLTSAEGGHRVVVIDAADQLNEAASNALLKPIEEPPAGAFIILVCHNPLAILPTIRSRCRHIPLSAPDITNFAMVLRHYLPDISLTDMDALYVLAQHSPGFALTLYGCDALSLYATALETMANPTHAMAQQRLALELLANKSPESWSVATHLVATVLVRALAIHDLEARSAPVWLVPDEAQALRAIQQHRGTTGLLRLQHEALQLWRNTTALNLDKQAAITRVLSAA